MQNSVAGPLIALACVLLTVLWGIRSTRRTLRANIMTTHRLKWLDHLREDLPLLLAIGERLHDTSLRVPCETEVSIRRELREVSKRLIVLMGREDELRVEFAELVRQFADTPSEVLAEKLEVAAQKVFRERWNQIREETGEAPRDKPTLPRPTSQPSNEI